MKEKSYTAVFHRTNEGKVDNIFTKEFHAYNLTEAKFLAEICRATLENSHKAPGRELLLKSVRTKQKSG